MSLPVIRYKWELNSAGKRGVQRLTATTTHGYYDTTEGYCFEEILPLQKGTANTKRFDYHWLGCCNILLLDE